MAACCDEKKDDEEEKYGQIDHSLDNVFAFSTSKGQMHPVSGDRREGLWTLDEQGNSMDRRELVNFYDQKFCRTSYWDLTQISFHLKHEKAVGSGMTLRTKPVVILSCAHNFVCLSYVDNKVRRQMKKHHSYCQRYGEKSWRSLRKITQFWVHDRYDGNPECGFDIAIGLTSEKIGKTTLNKKKLPNRSTLHYDLMSNLDYVSVLKKGMSIEVAGYPGEKKGMPYTHQGLIHDVKKTSLGGYILMYKIDTTPGNSGSPVYLTDKSCIAELRRKKGGKFDKVLIAIHTGSDRASECGFATLLTNDLSKWMSEIMKSNTERRRTI